MFCEDYYIAIFDKNDEEDSKNRTILYDTAFYKETIEDVGHTVSHW